MGLFFKFLETKDIPIPLKNAQRFFWLLFASILATYALAVAWAKPLFGIFLINSLGVILQLAALFFFLQVVWKNRQSIISVLGQSDNTNGIQWPRYLLPIAFYALLAKVVMQAAVVIPAIAKVAYTIRNFVIGFIHLILLAVISTALVAFAQQAKLINRNRWINTGLVLLLSGILLSEGVLFLQGTLLWGGVGFLPKYYEGLFGVSTLMPIGLAFILGGNLLPKQ